MFKHSAVVLFSGKAGVGKTTSANFCKNLFDKNSKIASFATGVKQVAYQMGWDGIKDDKGRQLLIDIGKSGRKYDKDIWAKYTFDKIIPEYDYYPFDMVFIDDWRFPNEGEYIKTNPLYVVYTVRIEAPEREILKGTPQYYDESETSLPSVNQNPGFYDFIVSNSGDFENLKSQLCDILDSIEDEQTW
jgi:DNA polymerase III delta prime subunit